MTNLTELRQIARKTLLQVATEAEVSSNRLWRAEHGFIELTGEERSRVEQVLRPALRAAGRTIVEFERAAVSA